jgi:hypothetical protein
MKQTDEKGNPLTYWGGLEQTKQETTLEEVAEVSYYNIDEIDAFVNGAKWQQERLCDSEVIQRIRASKSDAEARRIIRTI